MPFKPRSIAAWLKFPHERAEWTGAAEVDRRLGSGQPGSREELRHLVARRCRHVRHRRADEWNEHDKDQRRDRVAGDHVEGPVLAQETAVVQTKDDVRDDPQPPLGQQLQ